MSFVSSASTCKSQAESQQIDVKTLLKYVLQGFLFEMTFELLPPKSITIEALDKKKDGTCGSVNLFLVKRALVEHIDSLVQDCTARSSDLRDRCYWSCLPGFFVTDAGMQRRLCIPL